MKVLTRLAFVLVSSLAFSTAFAAEPFNMGSAKAMDENHDGKITKEEYMKRSHDMEAWNKMDTNKDGTLDEKEIQIGFNSK